MAFSEWKWVAALVGATALACTPGQNNNGDGGETDGGGTADGGGTTDGGGTADGGGATTTKTIGAAGGTLSVSGSVALQIPAGALAGDTEITVTPTSVTPPNGVSAISGAFVFGPAGQTFATPITVSFALTSLAPSGTKVYWSQAGSTTQFDALEPTLAGSGAIASAQVSHFSIGFVGAPSGSSTGGGCTAADDLAKSIFQRYPPTRSTSGAAGPIDRGSGGQLYLGGAQGLFAAADGQRFEPVNPVGLSQTSYGTQTVDAANDWIYRAVASGNDLAFQRRHANGCWEAAGTLAAAYTVNLLAVASNGDVFGIARLRDNRNVAVIGAAGAAWTVKGEVPSYTDMLAAFAPSDPLRIYYGWTYSGAHMRTSSDGGATWGNPVSIGGNTLWKLTSIAGDPTGADVVYAAVSGGLFKSSTGGTSFVEEAPQPPGVPVAVRVTADHRVWVISADSGTTGNGGLFVKAGGASAWTVVGDLPQGEAAGSALAITEGTPLQIVRVSATGAIWKSADGGQNWTSDFAGLPGLRSDPLVTHPTAEGTFYAADNPTEGTQTWYRTTDGGASWTRINIGDYGIAAPVLITNGGVLLAFAQVTVNDAPHLGVRSTDDGAHFTPMNGLPIDADSGLGSMFGSSWTQNIWYDKDPNVAYYRHGVNDLYRTDDAGANWAKVADLAFKDSNNTAYPARLLVDTTTAQRIYNAQARGGVEPDKFLRSTDAGANWTEIALPAGQWQLGTSIIDLAGRVWMEGYDANFAQKVYALEPGATAFTEKTVPSGASGQFRVFGDAVVRGNYRTTDGGANWTQASFTNPTPDVFSSFAFTHRANAKRVLFNMPALRNGLMP